MASTPFVRLVGLAERQHSVFTRAQAFRCGLTIGDLRGLVRRGIAEQMHRRVYRLRGSQVTFEARVLAAVFAAGAPAVASHDTSARLWQVEGTWSDQIHVTVLCRRRVSVAGVVIHQPRGPVEVTKIGVIPVTSCSQTLIDVAPRVSETALEDALDDTRRRNLVVVDKLLPTVVRQRRPGRTGLAKLQWMLEVRVGTPVSGSTKENELLRLFRAAGLPDPVPQYEIYDADGTFVAQPDFAYPDAKVAIEFDSYAWHGSRRLWEKGKRRDARMAALGWLVVPVTDRSMTALPTEVVEDIWRALASRWST